MRRNPGEKTLERCVPRPPSTGTTEEKGNGWTTQKRSVPDATKNHPERGMRTFRSPRKEKPQGPLLKKEIKKDHRRAKNCKKRLLLKENIVTSFDLGTQKKRHGSPSIRPSWQRGGGTTPIECIMKNRD